MLNISENRISEEIFIDRYDSFKRVISVNTAKSLVYWVAGFFLTAFVVLFLPWRQNINGRGNVTTLYPFQRPQTIVSTVDGRIEAWYVNEGDTIKQGDTILYLSEIKDKFFDPKLIERTSQQIDAKEGAMQSYEMKAQALANQIDALEATLQLKLEEYRNKVAQSRFKVRADSIDLIAARVNDSLAIVQLDRWETLFAQDLKSRTDLEKMRKQRQEAQAKLISQEQKLEVSKRALTNAQILLNNVANEYQEKIQKAQSERQSALSSLYGTEADVAKMENELANYEYRQNFRYIVAPQGGIINKALKPGIGETVKQGEGVVSIVSVSVTMATEIFVRPVDVPLIKRGQPVRLEFDGWPAIIFGAGWPGANFGTFGGRVFAIENDISSNGKYRVLIAEDPDDPWPKELRVGGGVNAFALLNTVPVWYELWRQLNGFPPEYYTGTGDVKGSDKVKEKEKEKPVGKKLIK